jgi:glycosyltransferase involved in cell wall biosynthesis
MMSVLEWCSYHAADLCISLAPGIGDGIAARGIARERIELIPNGCDVNVFGAREATGWRPAAVRADDLLAVFAGAHGEANGLDAVLDAAAVLQRRARTDIKLLLIGEGKQKDRLVRRARAEGLPNVVFHEPVDKVKLTGLFSAADVGMQILANVPAFYYGTSPNKFFDYLAAGLPVLNNYPGWVAELITEHDAGIAVPPEDPEAFADALEAFAADPDRRRQMGRHARRLAEQKFNRDLQAERFVNALERVAHGEAAI